MNRVRPRIPPPPPPTNPAEAKSPKSLSPTPKIVEQLEKNKEVKTSVKPSIFYENAEFHNKAGTASPASRPANAQQTTAPRKTGTVNVSSSVLMCD